jgi:hypothetical protein
VAAPLLLSYRPKHWQPFSVSALTRRFAMRNRALIHDRHETASNHRLQVVPNEAHFDENDIEARIERLTKRFNKISAVSHLVWLKSGPHIFDPALDLSVKIESIRWMLRIAKPMSEPAREVMFLRIENSLRKLEAEVDSQVRAAGPRAVIEPIRLRHCAHA